MGAESLKNKVSVTLIPLISLLFRHVTKRFYRRLMLQIFFKSRYQLSLERETLDGLALPNHSSHSNPTNKLLNLMMHATV